MNGSQRAVKFPMEGAALGPRLVTDSRSTIPQVGVKGSRPGKELRHRGMSCQAAEWGKGALEPGHLRRSGLHPQTGRGILGAMCSTHGGPLDTKVLSLQQPSPARSATAGPATPPLPELAASTLGRSRVSSVTRRCQHLHQRSRACGHRSRHAS